MDEVKVTGTVGIRKEAMTMMIQAIAAKPALVGTPGTAEAAAKDIVKGADIIAAFISESTI